jgi:hypothetical protein
VSRESIFAEIAEERRHQDEDLWGGAAHDDTLSLERWIVIMTRQLGLACWDGSPDDVCHKSEKTAKYDPARYRKQVLILIAVGVAALEAFDRRHTPAPLRNGYAQPMPAPFDPDARATAAAGELWDAGSGALPATPPEEFWRQVAARAGGPILLLDKQHSAVWQSVTNCKTYAVAEEGANAWEAENYFARVTPDGTVTRKEEARP